MRSLLVATLLAIACTGDVTSGASLTPGTYRLHSINGQPLPYPISVVDANNKFEFFAGTVTVYSDGTFGDVSDYRSTQNGVASQQVAGLSGQWTQEGLIITFAPSDDEPYTMRWDGGRKLTQNTATLTLIYVR